MEDYICPKCGNFEMRGISCHSRLYSVYGKNMIYQGIEYKCYNCNYTKVIKEGKDEK